MIKVNMIAAVNKNWAIGYGGELLYEIPKDMKFFKQKTSKIGGNMVIMGRKTYESIGLKNGLPGRFNVVLTQDPGFDIESKDQSIVVAHSLQEVYDKYLTNPEYESAYNECFVIGGEQIYDLFLPIASKCYITFINGQNGPEDAWFPRDLSKSKEWILVSSRQGDTLTNTVGKYPIYYFDKYERITN